MGLLVVFFFFFFKQKTAYEMRISDWSSDVCSSDLSHSPTTLWSPASRHTTRFRFQNKCLCSTHTRPFWQCRSDYSAPHTFAVLLTLACAGRRIDRKSTRLNSSH